MTTAQKPVPEAPKADFTPEVQSAPQPSARELELEARIKELETAALEPSDEQSKAASKLKKGFEVPKGEEKYTHVLETQVNGEAVEPRIRAYDPAQYASMISKQAGYKGEILTAKK